ncbi:hypothetical protein KFE25_008927 [Diacronema lutheri]|uniref:Uncharacterized protein n=1 Tax=Diacronema lutheri TaxID=2081491 RepID=A0A8J5XWU2_DIALT|nr:hypothetical protein KFE25_008927 [Diacronema lutheri]
MPGFDVLLRAPIMTVFFHQQGRAAANMHTDDLDIDAPSQLNNLDRGKKISVARAVQTMQHGRFERTQRKWYLEQAIKRSNETRPGRMYIDPYGATTGNLWAENYEMKRYQKGGQTSLAGRSQLLQFTPLVQRKMDRRQLERSQFVLDETTRIGDRFIPALKPVCKRDIGPDPYDVGRGDLWGIADVGLGRDKSLWTSESLRRRDSSIVRPQKLRMQTTL